MARGALAPRGYRAGDSRDLLPRRDEMIAARNRRPAASFSFQRKVRSSREMTAPGEGELWLAPLAALTDRVRRSAQQRPRVLRRATRPPHRRLHLARSLGQRVQRCSDRPRRTSRPLILKSGIRQASRASTRHPVAASLWVPTPGAIASGASSHRAPAQPEGDWRNSPRHGSLTAVSGHFAPAH